MKAWLARLCGHIGCWFVGKADELDLNWDAAPPKYAPWLGELDEELGPHNCPTWPHAPRVPQIIDDEREPTVRRMRPCSPPPPAPKGERRVICVEDKRVSVTPGPGFWWSAGGRS